MTAFRRCLRHVMLCVATGGLLAACGTGPENGTVQVVMNSGGTASASLAPVLSLSAAGDVALTSIESIMLPIVRIDLKPASAPDDEAGDDESGETGSASEEEAGQWIRLDVPAGTTVDLLSLPAVGGQEIGEGDVVATTYKEIRLVCDGVASINLLEPVTLPGGTVIGDDEPLEQPLTIPSCTSSGLKIKGGTFAVPADGEGTAVIEVSTDATVQSINWNPQGFRMSPVMKLPN